MRRLVVNGDDFGLTPGINAGIVQAHRAGVLSSASLFANAPATAEAIALAGALPTLGVGCHLTLVDGRPVLPSAQVSTLVTRRGQFRASWAALLAALMAGRIALYEVERELTAQIERLQAAGLRLTHLDSHKHVHLAPPLFEVVVRLARRFDVPVVRVPFERPALRLFRERLLRPGPRRQALENLALSLWALRARRALERAGLPPAPAFFGRVDTGFLNRAALATLVHRLPDGVSELMTHPGYADEPLGQIRTRLRASRAAELALLTNPSTVTLLREAGVKIVRHDGRAHLCGAEGTNGC